MTTPSCSYTSTNTHRDNVTLYEKEAEFCRFSDNESMEVPLLWIVNTSSPQGEGVTIKGDHFSSSL